MSDTYLHMYRNENRLGTVNRKKYNNLLWQKDIKPRIVFQPPT
jgi:hypothetical protein